jgi:hypothetical protein
MDVDFKTVMSSTAPRATSSELAKPLKALH